MPNRTPIAEAVRQHIAMAKQRNAERPRGECLIFARATAQGDELFIYGDIGDYWWSDDNVTARKIAEALAGLNGTQLTLRINSYGGAVDDGIAIYNNILLHKKRTGATVTARVDGIAASIASLILQAGDERVAPANTTVMVHAPWTSVFTWGNANDLEAQFAQVVGMLRHYEDATATTYAARTGMDVDAIKSSYYDGIDHYLTAAKAAEQGFIDRIEEDEDADDADDAADAVAAQLAKHGIDAGALAAGIQRYPQAAPAFNAALHTTTSTTPIPGRQHPAGVPAVAASARRSSAAADITPPAAAGIHNEATTMPDNTNPQAVEQAAVEARTQAITALQTRNAEIRQLAEPHFSNTEVRALYDTTIAGADPAVTAADFGKQVLAILAKGRESLAGDVTVVAGVDESDRFREAGVNAIMARAGLLDAGQREVALRGNPLANATLLAMGEQALIRQGERTRDMDRDALASRILAQGTGDFLVLLENALHKIIVARYNAQAFTWTRFCKTGTLSDYRPHGRYQLSSFSDLAAVNEHGEYTTGTLGDGAKESIQAKRKGRILELTPETLVNDDLGFLVDLAGTLGLAAGRTIEKDVYALLALNAGAGPTMSDGKALFHTDHNNIDSSSAAPTVASMDATAAVLRNQKDIGNNDYLDLEPAIWLGAVAKAGAARVVVNSEYDPDSNNKLQRYNIARNIVRDVVSSPRLTGNRWYMFADPAIAPVLEVAFLNGVREPQIKQDEHFRTEGVRWRVTHKYGVAGVSWIGAATNAGA